MQANASKHVHRPSRAVVVVVVAKSSIALFTTRVASSSSTITLLWCVHYFRRPPTMAIPFVLPCDQEECTHASEAHLEQLLWDLIDIYQQIQQIQILLRARMHNRLQQSSRVCGSRTSSSSTRHVVIVPDLVASNLPPPPSPPPLLDADALRRSSRWQASPTIEFKPCYYRESIITDCTLNHQSDELTRLPLLPPSSTDCIDAGSTPPPDVVFRRSSPTSSSPAKSLLARLLPTASTTSRTLWTAVLCVFGWRLFRAR